MEPSSETDVALAALVTDAVDAIYVLDPEGRFLYANPAACALTGYEADELEGALFEDFASEGDRERVRWMLGAAAERESGSPVTYELDLRRKDGRTVSVEVRSTRLVWDGRVVGLQGIARDVSARRARTRELEHQALHDPLTDLPNRALFQDRLEQSVLVERRKGVSFAVLLVDLDGFKEVNDELGHAVGDRVLAEVAGRLRKTLRASDTVARLGGDEFAVLIDDCGSSGARTVAGKILRALDRPVAIGGPAIRVGASIGIGLCPDHGEDPDELLERADAAMYAAKQGRLGVAVHGVTSSDFGRRARRRPPSGSGRLSGFLAGAAAALLVVAGVTTPPMQETPRSQVPADPADPSGDGMADVGTDERAVERRLFGASSVDLVGVGASAELTLLMTPVAFRSDAVDDDRSFRTTGPLSRVPDGMWILERAPSGGAAKERAPGPARGEDPAPEPPAVGKGKEESGEKPGPPPPLKRGGGDDPPGKGRSEHRSKRGWDGGPRKGRSEGAPARPRKPRRPGDAGGKADRPGGQRSRAGHVERGSGSGGPSRSGSNARGGNGGQRKGDRPAGNATGGGNNAKGNNAKGNNAKGNNAKGSSGSKGNSDNKGGGPPS